MCQDRDGDTSSESSSMEMGRGTSEDDDRYGRDEVALSAAE